MSEKFYILLDELRSTLLDDLQAVEQLMQDKGNSDVSYIANIVQHLILSGGKRIRPIMLLAVCKMLEFNDDIKVRIAAAIEFIHSATLLHDDVIDQSELRRGSKTSNSLWGNKASVLVGDFLFATGFQWIVSCGSIPLLSVLSQASSIIISGEIKQMIYSSNLDITVDRYLEVISAKTAALFSATCESAAVIAGVSERYREALRGFGYNFGIAFQITDDILDYTAKCEKLGKNIGQDFSSDKVTLPVIMAYADANEEEKRALDALWKDKESGFDSVYSYIKAHNIIEKSTEFAGSYIEAARHHLDLFPDSPYKAKLHDLLESVSSRDL